LERTLQGRSAIVTGASRLNGIGAAICRRLAERGAAVFFTYWTPYDKLMPWGVEEGEPETLLRELQEQGVQSHMAERDLAVVGHLESLIPAAAEAIGEPWILVNNATHSTRRSYKDITAEELDQHYAVNVRAPLLLASYFGRAFGQGFGGRIINITSGQFQGPMPDEIGYVATKGGVDAMTVSLAAELGPKGITVNAVNPGPTDTGWMDERLKQELLPKFPLGRIGMPDDAARLVAFLATDDAQWITGQILHSEGGFLR